MADNENTDVLPVKSRRWLRQLRIAWTAFFAVLTVALCVLWVRSYWQIQIWIPCAGHDVMVGAGQMVIDETYVLSPEVAPAVADIGRDDLTTSWGHRRLVCVSAGTGIKMPFWPITMFAFTVAAVPWLPWRFSLRTMLIVTTLVAVVLGLVVWRMHS